MSNITNRKLHLDLLRIIAILFVIYNHTNEKGYYLYAFDCPMILRIIYIITGAIIAVAVPIFFMISGSLLIPKNESIRDLYRRRVLRMVLVLVVFSVIQYAYQIVFDETEMSVMYFLKNTFSDNITPAYWYLYSYLAYLICLPLIRKMALNMTNKEYKYLFCVFLVIEGLLAGILFATGLGNMNAFFVIPFFNRIVIYPLLGYYMEHRMGEEEYNSRGLIKWIIAMILVVALIVIMTLVRNLPYEEFTTYDKGLFTTGFTFILVGGVYYLVRMLFKGRKIHKGGAKVITTLSSTVFGVYLIENIIRDNTLFVYNTIASVIGKFLGAWLWCLIVFIIGAVIIYIIKLIPGVKKLL